MYFKLTIRNAKRSIIDYLLYISAMIILLSIMELSNCIAAIGNMQAGFQTASLPLLIMMILIILVGYIDDFMLRQRAKEFGNYLLLGMEKGSLSRMFLCEFFLIGMICFVIGSVVCIGLCAFLHMAALLPGEWRITFLGQGALETFLHFCLVEAVCAFRIKQHLDKMQIRDLMCEKLRTQRITNHKAYQKWGLLFAVNLLCLMGLLCGIVFLPGHTASPMISVIALPLLGAFFAFYRWLFGYLYKIRQEQSTFLYQGNRLYMTAQITSTTKTSAAADSVFGICLLFSAMSFFLGTIMLQPDIRIFDRAAQQWMGFLQICICIVFLVIYFSIASLQQIVAVRQEAKGIRTLYDIGKSRREIQLLVKRQTAVRLLLPALMTFLILLAGVPLVNLKLNSLFPAAMHNILLKSTCYFAIGFLFLYYVYFSIVYTMSRKCALEPAIKYTRGH